MAPLLILLAALQVASAPPGFTWLHVRALLASTTVRRVVVEVPNVKDSSTTRTELRVAAQVASGAVAIPLGPGRLITLHGFDENGRETHRAVETIDLVGTADVAVSVSLVPIEDERPDRIRQGTFVVRVNPREAALVVGQTLQLTAIVTTEQGDTVSPDVRWSSRVTGRITVSPDGLVTALDTGVVDVYATYGRAGAASHIRIGQRFGSACTASLAEQVLARMNDERRKAGLVPLTLDARLVQAAEQHSKDMASHNFLGHDGSDGGSIPARMSRVGFSWYRVAENVAGGQETPDDVVRGWMGSPGHRANILDPGFRQVGLGFAAGEGTKFGRYWTADFGVSRDGTRVVASCSEVR